MKLKDIQLKNARRCDFVLKILENFVDNPKESN